MSVFKQVPDVAAQYAPKLTAATLAASRAYNGVDDASRLEMLTKSDEANAGTDLPKLSISTITSQLRKLNSRSKALWDVQYLVAKFFSWQQPAFTLSILCCYTLICLHPYLLAALPMAGVILGVMVPGYEQRHPRTVHIIPPDKPEKPQFDEMGDYTPDLEPQKAVLSEQDKDFVMVLRHLQLVLTDVVKSLEKIDDFIYGAGAFVDEKYSSALFILLSLLLPLIVFVASFIPIKLWLIYNGWGVVVLVHPSLKRKAKKIHHDYFEGKPDYFGFALETIRDQDIVLDSEPESRVVEIFELQRQGPTPRVWDPWVFTPVIYMVKSPFRISEARPPGTRFIDDVLPPEGWQFDEDDDGWQVDDNPKAWVHQRGVQNVEIDVEHHWAYDNINGVRGDWRRRRWLRTAYRNAADPLLAPTH